MLTSDFLKMYILERKYNTCVPTASVPTFWTTSSLPIPASLRNDSLESTAKFRAFPCH